ncbi:MAG: recombinase family protein, partial [Syntrophales bacterium]|nr:recombinase family protein [Syntrophales bacterium]
MNCVIYLRVSTKEQAEKADSKEGYSIPAQRDACVKYIKEKGWELIDEYLDRGESARSAARPQLQEMLGRITK